MLGLISLGIKSPEIFIKKIVKYRVIPIGIKTTIPAIKLFLTLEKKDFFKLLPDGVTVAHMTLTHMVQVQILVGQPI